MPITAEYVQVVKHNSIASYTTTVPTLILWTCVFIRILVQKEKSKFLPLIVICVLMIVS